MKFLGFDAFSSWVSYATDTPGLYLMARFVPDERGELVVRDLVLSAKDDRRITAADLRGIKVSAIEGQANAPAFLSQHLREKAQPEDEYIAKLRVALAEVPEEKRAAKRPKIELTRPDGQDPEGFYQQVADAYRLAMAETTKPAMRLADVAGVPVGTARRWINEARKRGFLPKGKPGRAG
ncbi:hypothetical protein AB0F88_10935 [Streptosporangium sp. NPDC023963]|uniref:hypothetical protein n=1 Tax=Streptosporangium sp. NPDC023963 TaxID=3155608 RepID=UPI00343C5617